MADANLFITVMDSDLVVGTFRSLLALHSESQGGLCANCEEEFPCATVRIIAAGQDAAIERGAGVPARGTHKFLYPECPQFSGGICHEHRDLPLSAAS